MCAFFNKCFSCEKEAPETEFKRCSRCKATLYCNAACQAKHWPEHKKHCRPSTVWYDKYRGCKDKTIHPGKLELVTWSGYEPNCGMMFGWGASWPTDMDPEEDEAYRKKVFYEECGGDEQRFFEEHYPVAFRWTCCGQDGGTKLGCEHPDPKKFPNTIPCTCDFCVMGKPVADSIYNDGSIYKKGLKLFRGPDPRSYNPAMAGITFASRTAMGLEM